MKSVNIDSKKATDMSKQIINIIKDIEKTGPQNCIICGGHGPLSMPEGNKLVNLENAEKLYC